MKYEVSCTEYAAVVSRNWLSIFDYHSTVAFHMGQWPSLTFEVKVESELCILVWCYEIDLEKYPTLEEVMPQLYIANKSFDSWIGIHNVVLKQKEP